MPLLWHGLLTVPPVPTEGLPRPDATRRPSVGASGTVRRPCHNRDHIRLRESLMGAGLPLRDEPTAAKTLAEVRRLYEPFVNTLSTDLMMALPPFVPAKRPVDNQQTSPGMDRSPGLSGLQAARARDEHFD